MGRSFPAKSNSETIYQLHNFLDVNISDQTSAHSPVQSCTSGAVRDTECFSVLPRPVLIISVEIIQHVCLSRACCQTMGISKCRVTQQGLCDTNITFTYNTHKHGASSWCGLVLVHHCS